MSAPDIAALVGSAAGEPDRLTRGSAQVLPSTVTMMNRHALTGRGWGRAATAAALGVVLAAGAAVPGGGPAKLASGPAAAAEWVRGGVAPAIPPGMSGSAAGYQDRLGPGQPDARKRAVIRAIPDSQWARMRRAGVVRKGCPASRRQLRRVEVWHVGFDNSERRGVIVVNADVAADVAEIFDDLFRVRFPIRTVQPIEAFEGDDDASMAADNTSAYNCRRPGQANAPAARSPHANGRAVDINPRENPWWDPRCSCFQPTAKHAARTSGKGKVLKGGVAWRAFTKRGWTWQDSATPDYQHFDTGYPSRPR